MRHGPDIARVGFFQLADHLEDATERLRVRGNLFGLERQTRQARDGLDLSACEAHVKKAANFGKNSFK
jgi:hypothetical protein